MCEPACRRQILQQPPTRHVGAGTPATDPAAATHPPRGSRHAGDRSCSSHPPATWEPACRRQVLQQPPTRHAGAGMPATDLASTTHPPCGSRHAGDRSCSSHPPAMWEPACRRQVLQQPPTRHVRAGMPATDPAAATHPPCGSRHAGDRHLKACTTIASTAQAAIAVMPAPTTNNAPCRHTFPISTRRTASARLWSEHAHTAPRATVRARMWPLARPSRYSR